MPGQRRFYAIRGSTPVTGGASNAVWKPVPGAECLITDLGSDERIARRLARMGVLPDRRLRVVRLAPLGDTVEVSVEQGELLALRLEDLLALGCDYQVLPLSQTGLWGAGHYRVSRINGGRLFRERMRQAGLRQGAGLRVVQAGRWPLQVQPDSTGGGLQLGRGEAEKILVERADGS